MIYLRSALFYLGEGLSTLPFFVISMMAIVLPPKPRSRVIALWAHFVTWWLKITCGLKHECVGLENIPDQPCVFACAHQSTWETITTQTFLPPLAWVLKKELLKIPFFGWGLWASRPIAIDRQDQMNALDQVVSQGVEKLREGRYVLIFPEGTRIAYGKTVRYKKGAAKLAKAADVPVIPMALDAGKYWSVDSWLIKPGTIRCVIGEPIDVTGKDDMQVTNEIQSWIQAQGL